MATGTRAGRKRESPKDWAAENDDFCVKKRKSDGSDSETDALVCKYCSVEINISGNGWDRTFRNKTFRNTLHTTISLSFELGFKKFV